MSAYTSRGEACMHWHVYRQQERENEARIDGVPIVHLRLAAAATAFLGRKMQRGKREETQKAPFTSVFACARESLSLRSLPRREIRICECAPLLDESAFFSFSRRP